MKKLVLMAVFLLGFSIMAVAADAPAVEVFGGYTFVRVDTTTAFDVEKNSFDLNMNGWRGAVAFNANKWAGFVADFGGHYGSVESEDIRAYSVMVGPRFAVRKGAVTPFFQALFGFAHVTADEGSQNDFRENDFAMAFGGGLDVNVNSLLAVRPVHVEYFTAKAGSNGHFSDNLRYSAGIVIKLGKR
jgi:opacity protein-like surface antigen